MEKGVDMQSRIDQELALLRKYYSSLEYQQNGQWVRIASHPLPPDWNKKTTDVAFQIPIGYPGMPPYGIYVPLGLLYKDSVPKDYKAAENRPPFEGTWGIFSWTHDAPWKPTGDLITGTNLLNWVRGFSDRFKEGI